MTVGTKFGLVGMVSRGPDVAIFYFDEAAIPAPAFKAPIECGGSMPHKAVAGRAPTMEEQLYIIGLKDAMSTLPSSAAPSLNLADLTSTLPAAPKPKPMGSGGTANSLRFSLIKDLGTDGFRDILGELVKMFETLDNSAVDLYISDYTENNLLYRYPEPTELGEDSSRDGDAFGYTDRLKRQWQGPFGYHTMSVRAYPPHSSWARDNLNEGDIVLLRNVRLKTSRNGFLEGNLHPDQKRPEQVDIRKPYRDDARVQAVRQRRSEYEKQRETSAAQQKTTEEPTLSKKAKKKLSKRLREEAAKGKALDLEAATAGFVIVSNAETSGLESKAVATGSSLNTHIRCKYPDVQLSTLHDLINTDRTNKSPGGVTYTLPFINQKRRVRVRVKDFDPPKIEDFCCSNDDPAYNPGGRKKGQAPWEFCFLLLLEDASVPKELNPNPAQLPVYVAQDRAEYLLDMKAYDFKNGNHTKKALAKLREKLFILWGDLEEKKDPKTEQVVGEVTNMPFECIIAEYGIPQNAGTKEKVQKFAIMDTRIM
ncbi:uncharacterized protein BDZ99DRAFT_465889 [Mytilinidion resinicola]|uniref:Protection of telomeres protein 1 ssDNA-binding domain-containing protein n=1 Tax=Mytilinidion resinicola TaxID=574789 RepID=A0A6A6YCA7_9PEZI|nr:uncharacterized protein BDZ99DRAFT_465889 [Mytilinidion resinicola]KAF2806239.1 hypothetical protein BDZ99DRAFT_465889 [Mytilinidion resinicola]